MKFTAKFLLVTLLVPLLILGVLSATLKFEILRPNFWLSTFERNNVYQLVAETFKKFEEDKIVSGGGNKNETKSLTDLISAENLKELFEKNITNLLNYANGKSSELSVFLPIKKLPKGLLPKNFANLPDQIDITTFLSKFDIKVITPDQIRNISLLGKGVTYFLILDLTISALFLFLLFLLTGQGSRFISLAATFILTGLIMTLSSVGGLNSKFGMGSLNSQSSPLQIIAVNILPPVVHEVSKAWIYIGIGFIALGVVLLLLKKK